jgi:hypothetical protein
MLSIITTKGFKKVGSSPKFGMITIEIHAESFAPGFLYNDRSV